jgi:uncharacterized membrane-anchored protein
MKRGLRSLHSSSFFGFSGIALLLALSLFPTWSNAPAFAQQDTTEATKAARIEADRKAAYAAVDKAAQNGPATIKLADQADLALPEDYVYVPQPEAGQLMRANGNSGGTGLLGLVFPATAGQHWWALVEFKNSGYVKDDEAKNWDPDALLKTLQEGTEAGNEDRLERGFPAIEVTGWVEPPVYDAATRRLVWSANVRAKGDASDRGSINYNTYVLGRDGYVSLDLITSPEAVAVDKAHADELLASIDFVGGKKYSDFNASTDHIAEFGIAALVGGLAIKKLGLLAVAGVFLLKVWKLALIGLVAVGAAVRRVKTFFTRRKPVGEPPEPQA